MPFMTRIPSDLARFGLKVELVPGWETRGSSSFAPAAVTCHWTAGPRGTTGRPSLNICVNGRTGIPGPLCNIYLARDGTCVVVAAGRANHAGVGGFRGLVGNSAVYGIEAECGGDGDWTAAQRDVYPRLVAALLSGLGRDASWAHGHHEWAPSRKIDIRDIITHVRSGAAVALSNPAAGGEDDMPYSEKHIQDLVYLAVRNLILDMKNGHNNLTRDAFCNLISVASADVTVGRFAALQGEIAGLRKALEALAAAPGQPVDLTAVRDAAEQGALDGVAQGIESLEVVVRPPAAGE